METPKMKFTIPFSPSVNHYWFIVATKGGGRKVLGKKGKQFREEVVGLLEGTETLTGRLGVRIKAFPPDRRKRDLDNMLKPTLDAIEHAGVYADDNQIDELSICREAPEKPGRLEIEIYERSE